MEQWRANQLIEQTNNKHVKPFRKLFTMSDWLTSYEYLDLLYFYFVGCADINQPTNL